MKRLLLLALPVLVGATEAPRCPEDMVWVKSSRTCIDRYEWPNQQGMRPAIAMTGAASIFDRANGLVMDAETLCKTVGKRPCELDEWIAACRGPRGSDYPFGSKLPERKPTPEEAKCNYAQFYQEPDERKVFLRDEAELKRLNQADPSGTRGCRSASGAEDMMGNVEEWIRCPTWLSPNGWCLAGRYWSIPEPCYRMVTDHDPGWHYYETGFRCCSDPG